MRYLLDHRAELEEALRGKHLLLMLDFDGTLAPIAPAPDLAALPPETRRTLRRLALASWCSVAIVSGRALQDVSEKVRVEGITYIGNHGLEIGRPGAPPESPVSVEHLNLLRGLRDELRTLLAAHPGVIVEDKVQAVAVHYRQADPADRESIKAVVVDALRRSGAGDRLEMTTGSMVVELRPAIGRDKGTIVRELMAAEARERGAERVLAIYLGDDATDEDAFREIRGRGWGVLVGEPRLSYGEYYLKNPDDVRRLLELLAARCDGEK